MSLFKNYSFSFLHITSPGLLGICIVINEGLQQFVVENRVCVCGGDIKFKVLQINITWDSKEAAGGIEPLTNNPG